MENKDKKEKPFQFVDKWEKPIAKYDLPGIGECRLCPMTVSDEIEFGKLYPKSKNEYTPDELARFTLRFLLKKSKEDKGPSLTEDEVNLIPKKLQEEMFEKFLERSSYLYRASESSTETDDKGTRTVKISEGDIIYHRNEGETATQYYQRVKCLYDQAQSERYKEIFKKMNFSSGLNDQIIKSIKNLDQMVKPLKGIEHLMDQFKSPFADSLKELNKINDIKAEPRDSFPHVDLKIPENPQLVVLKDIRNAIRDNHIQSVSVFADISKTLMGMLNELQGSTRDANRSLRIALFSLFATVIIGLAQLWVDIKNEDMREVKLELHKMYKQREDLMFRLQILESKKLEQDQLILKELQKISTKNIKKK